MKKKKNFLLISTGQIVIYTPKGRKDAVQVQLDPEKETLWLTLNQMTQLFGRSKSVISRHLKNIFDSKELDRKAVVAKNATTALDGKTYQVDCYNLDVVISVGYREKKNSRQCFDCINFINC